MLKYVSSFIWDDDVVWCQRQTHLKYLANKQILHSNLVLLPPPPKELYEMTSSPLPLVRSETIDVVTSSPRQPPAFLSKSMKKRYKKKGINVSFLHELHSKLPDKVL